MKSLFLFLALAALVVLGSPAWAQCNGYDQFQTDPNSVTHFDLGPGIGDVSFQGVPIDSSQYGNADTIIQRSPSGTNGQCTIKVWAMLLKSTQPVQMNGSSFYVYATINDTGGTISTNTLPQPDQFHQPDGNLTITMSGSNGGTFDSTLNVQADLIFVPATGGSLTDSGNAHQQGPTKQLVAVDVVYHTSPSPNYPGCLQADVFYVWAIPGHAVHRVLAATITCGGVGAPSTSKPVIASKTKLGQAATLGGGGVVKACACAVQ